MKLFSDGTDMIMHRDYKEDYTALVSIGHIVVYTCEAFGEFAATSITPNILQQLGYEQDEFLNTPDFWASHIHPNDKEDVFNNLSNLFQNGTHSHEYRFLHKDESYRWMHDTLRLLVDENGNPQSIVGYWTDVTERKQAELFNKRHTQILEMIAKGNPASEIYNEIALLYEERHPGMRCSMLELDGNKLLHGGAPSLPEEYCDAVHGLENGPNIGSCGTSTYTGKRVLVENIETDPKWADIKHVALPHGMRSCWSEPIKSSSGKVLGAFGMYYNHPALPNEDESSDLTSAGMLASIVMERDQNQKRMRELAYTDELTGLSSRGHLHLSLKDLIETSARYNRQFCLLYIDLDNFKDINDSLGHDTGDLHLQEIAKRLKSVGRKEDIVARLGGDEFCIVVKEIADNYNAVNVAQRCLDIISIPSEVSGRKFIQTCSIGITRYPDDGMNLQTLLKAADTALYTAKENGKNNYAFYNKALTKKIQHRFKVEQYLREAIEKQTLSLVYQPQVDINTGKIIGVEALSRWYHPQLGQVSPVDFIAIAERIGMIKRLTEWVLKAACTQAVSWKKAGFPAMRIAINISAIHFLDNDFVPLIKRVINDTGMTTTELELEVTESVVQTSQENLAIFKKLKELGVLLAIDDFGTGYSSFASLKHLNVDFLKIDKYFIDDMLTDKKTQLLVGSMIEMGHNLGYKIIAEGIEKPEQFSMLKKLGCETAQGYLFSKPVSAGEVSKLLRDTEVFRSVR